MCLRKTSCSSVIKARRFKRFGRWKHFITWQVTQEMLVSHFIRSGATAPTDLALSRVSAPSQATAGKARLSFSKRVGRAMTKLELAPAQEAPTSVAGHFA